MFSINKKKYLLLCVLLGFSSSSHAFYFFLQNYFSFITRVKLSHEFRLLENHLKKSFDEVEHKLDEQREELMQALYSLNKKIEELSTQEKMQFKELIDRLKKNEDSRAAYKKEIARTTKKLEEYSQRFDQFSQNIQHDQLERNHRLTELSGQVTKLHYFASDLNIQALKTKDQVDSMQANVESGLEKSKQNEEQMEELKCRYQNQLNRLRENNVLLATKNKQTAQNDIEDID